jgi:hypothetical protein
MKVTLTIELALPDDTPVILDAYEESLPQLVFDAYVNFTTCSHADAAVQWCAKGKIGSDNEDSSAKQIYQYHNTWRDICRAAKWSMVVS